MEILYLSAKELAARWKMSPKTLRQWRWKKKGPHASRISGHVLYKLEDVESYESSAKELATRWEISPKTLNQWCEKKKDTNASE
jgi:DNA-binding transcriptional regulator YiaG